MRKTLWTLNIGNYAPEIVEMTYPFLLAYAQKIGADFCIINSRRFPKDFPVVYEKLQIFELGKENDWNIFVDSDALIFPDLFDVTERIGKDTVAHYGRDHAGNRFRADKYFRRDSRDIGSANWFTVASDWTHDLWRPLDDISMGEAFASIKPSAKERLSGIDSPHLIDDFTLSRNIARFGLKHTTVLDIMHRANDQGMYVWHTHFQSLNAKRDQMKSIFLSNQLDQLAEFKSAQGMHLKHWLLLHGTKKKSLTIEKKRAVYKNGDSTHC